MSIPKRRLFASFWDSPPLEDPPGHINPKTIWNNSIPAPLWPCEWSVCHIPVFPTCNVRKRRNSKCQQRVLVTVEEACLSKVWLLTVDDLTLIRTEKGSFSVRIGDLCRVARCLLRQVRRRAFLFRKYFRKLCKFIWKCEDCPISLRCNSELIHCKRETRQQNITIAKQENKQILYNH